MNQNKVLSVRNLVLIAMFSALAAVLETIQVAVPFAPPFYKLEALTMSASSETSLEAACSPYRLP